MQVPTVTGDFEPAAGAVKAGHVTSESGPVLSVLIATRNRAARLQRALASLDAAQDRAQVECETVVIDNGSTDGTAAVLDDWVMRGPQRVRLHVAEPGRSRALNHALGVARAPLLAFTDDDVEVAASWIESLLVFFDCHPEYGAAMGRVCPPPAASDDLLARVARYPCAVPLFDAGDTVKDVTHMWGCNMAVRRAVFAAVGSYDERLGVGASGLYEDEELSNRIRQSGVRIAYMPDAVVYHDIDPGRVTLQWCHEFYRRLARSHFLVDPPRPWPSHLLRTIDAALACGWWRLRRQPQRHWRAWGRMVQHRELLRLQWRRGRTLPERE